MEIKVFDQLVKIELDPTKKTGVLLSGGMDSSIMLFLILTEIKEKNLDINLTVYNVPNKNDNAAVHSKRVIDFLENYFCTKINFSSIGNGDLPSLKLINLPAKILLFSKKVDVLYSGQNQFPPEAQEWESYKKSLNSFSRRDPDLPELDNVKYPFIRLYKHHILELYRIFNILELTLKI